MTSENGMRVGLSLGPEGDLVENIELAEDMDFIEFGLGEGERLQEDIDAEEVNEKLEELDLDLVVHLPFRQVLATAVPELNESILEYHDRLLEFSTQMGAEKAVVHVDTRGKHEEIEEELILEQIEKLDELGKEHGIEIVFENLGHWRGIELEELGTMLEELEVSMCFDTGHAFSEVGQEETEEFLEEYSHLISHIHFTDTREGRDMHLPIGSSEVGFEGMMEKFEDFDGTACMEIFTDDPDYIQLSKWKVKDLFEEG
ncbi:MAG: sugar phosphate isomerase/epimerase [Nanohaloarchaea archaeon]|nr:sugar phosphate isomerase/epimerase [Candidatus Nanohaloarchaea archaeon]